MTNTNKRNKLIIIGIFAVFIIVPLLFTIIHNIGGIIRTSRIDAWHSDIQESLRTFLIDEVGFSAQRDVFHEIYSDNQYIAVLVSSLAADDFGDSAIAIVRVQNGNYELTDYGTDQDSAFLLEQGVPKQLIDTINDSETMDYYSEYLSNSLSNPEVKYPLISELPYKTDSLRVSYHFDEDYLDNDGVSVPIIEVWGAEASDRKVALERINDYGDDVGIYKLEFHYFFNDFLDELPTASYWTEEELLNGSE